MYERVLQTISAISVLILITHNFSNFDLSVSYVGCEIKLLDGRGGACSSRYKRFRKTDDKLYNSMLFLLQR